MNQNEQSGKEQQCGPFNVVKRFFEIVCVGSKEHDHGTYKRYPRHSDMGDGMEEEIQDHQDEDESCNLEHGRVLDAVLGFKFCNIPDATTGKFVSIEPLEQHERRHDTHQNSWTHFDDEIVECHAVL